MDAEKAESHLALFGLSAAHVSARTTLKTAADHNISSSTFCEVSIQRTMNYISDPVPYC